MAEENTDITIAAESNGSERSQDESCDIPVIAVTEISEPEDITEKSIDIPVIAVTEIKPEDITEESIDIPYTVEINEPEGSNVKVTKETNTPGIRPKIFSRYLLPSAGSCHDLCKYGMKHSFEGKLESPVLRKVKSTIGNGRDFKRITISLAKQDKRAMSMKSSLDCNTRIKTNDLKEDLISSPKIVNLSPKRPLPPIKDVETVVVHCSATKLASSQSKGCSLARQGGSSTKRNKQFAKGKEQDGGSSSCTNCIEEDKKALVAPAVSCTPKKHVKRVANAGKNIVGRCGLRNQSRLIKIKSVQSNNEDKQEETLYMIEPSNKKETEGSSQNIHTADLSQPHSLSATDNGLKHDRELDQTPKVPPLSVEKKARHGRTGISSKKLLASSSLSWGFKGLRHKKFGIVCTQSSPSSSTSPSNPIHSNHGGLASGNDVKKYPKVERKSRPRRMGISESENRDSQSRRLKFRKGRVVDIQPENNTPKRLKFRRVRLLGESQNFKSNSGKRSIQGKEANHNEDEAKEMENNALRLQDQELKRKKNFTRKETIDGKPTTHRINYERVVLRHQDSKEKKELQNLFNNVIEETASKLAQTRKSKVKALVGAFETVISLQDTRPSATISA